MKYGYLALHQPEVLIEIPIPRSLRRCRRQSIGEVVGAIDDQINALDAEADALDALLSGTAR